MPSSPVSFREDLSSAFVPNRVTYSLIFPVLTFSLPLRLLWLDPRLLLLDPRLPWLALRLPWPVVLCALQMARLVCARDLQSHERALRAHDDGLVVHLVLLHRKKVVSVPRWSSPAGLLAAPLRTSGRSRRLHREAPRRSLGKIATLVLGYAPRSMRSSSLLLVMPFPQGIHP
jgi:hypothetical protein